MSQVQYDDGSWSREVVHTSETQPPPCATGDCRRLASRPELFYCEACYEAWCEVDDSEMDES